MIGNAIGIFTITFFGWLSDIIGRRPVMAACFVGSALYVWLGYFQLMATGETFYIMLAVAVSPAILQPLSLGSGAAMFSEFFSDARLRFSGFGLAKQLGNVLGGGLLPVASASIMAATNNSLVYVIMLFGALNTLSAVATYMMPETKNTRM
jgi:MFS family permease